MAKEQTSAQKEQEPSTEPVPAQPFVTKKMLMIGIPVILVEALLVYFLTAMFVVPRMAGGTEDAAEAGKAAALPPEPQIFVVNDLIVNPAGTNGTRFLLTTVGFEVSTPEARADLEKKELQVRDLLNSILTAKGLDSLVDVRHREGLRREITDRMRAMLKNGQPQQVYFSKFIIQ